MATSGPGGNKPRDRAGNCLHGFHSSRSDYSKRWCQPSWKDSFQEIDIKGVTMPVTKHNYIVKDIEKLADTIREAFQIAQSGRKGPVLVDITKDVTAAKTYFESMEPAVIHQSVRQSKKRVSKKQSR